MDSEEEESVVHQPPVKTRSKQKHGRHQRLSSKHFLESHEDYNEMLDQTMNEKYMEQSMS